MQSMAGRMTLAEFLTRRGTIAAAASIGLHSILLLLPETAEPPEFARSERKTFAVTLRKASPDISPEPQSNALASKPLPLSETTPVSHSETNTETSDSNSATDNQQTTEQNMRRQQLPAIPTHPPAPAASQTNSKYTASQKSEQSSDSLRVFDPRLRNKFKRDTGPSRSEQIDAFKHKHTFTDVHGRTVRKNGRYCSVYTPPKSLTETGLWSLPFVCDTSQDEGEKIKRGIAEALRDYRQQP
ncbi:hypothetical protein TERTU_0387 [Teredinibacter turnerae T7901]|uniref:Uncharacterized protein n=2 Tax=Teredinibacter turnerae TaxID=2426 RepID=C5BMC4_TERTT|nr:hypothetical protein TERTU_0387 [Teredinibacter turnerae T7901]